MLNRIRQLFHRYTEFHGRLFVQGFDLKNNDGDTLGCIDRIGIERGRLIVEGWTFASMVELTCGNHSVQESPSLTRVDVAQHYDLTGSANFGFRLDLPNKLDQKILSVNMEGQSHTFKFDGVGEKPLRKMRLRYVVPFLSALLRSTPDILRWRFKQDLSARARIKTSLGLNAIVERAILNASLFAKDKPKSVQVPNAAEITIILPVYNAFDLLPAVLTHVLENTDLPYRFIIVEDMSTDEAVRPYLHQWHAGLASDIKDRVEVLENAENLGFIRSVNRAFDRALELGNHVVLLNSDAFVPKDWAGRLLAPIWGQDDVATVTPMSNDAEIFNVPMICQRTDLAEGVACLIDDAAKQLNSNVALAEAPTGVGFCMAMNIRYLKRIPQLDTVFGRGYGEEVDWCRQASALGGKHLGHAGVFVEHRGGVSFGSDEKLKLIQANNQIISQRYPGYDQMVQDFIRYDPLNTPRLALAFAWAGAQAQQKGTGPVPVYLAHDMGGGAEHYLANRIGSDLEQRDSAVVLRIGGQLRWQLEVHSANGVVRSETDDLDVVQKMMALLPARRVVYSCGVGDRDALELPGVLCGLAQGADDKIEVLLHDFFPLSPSYTLLDFDGVYRGVPAENTPDKAHWTKRLDAAEVSLQTWRTAWAALMYAADHVTVFSQDSANHVAKAYPDLGTRLRVHPHEMLDDVPQVPRGAGKDGKPVIGVLGNIGLQKGAAVLRDLSTYLAKSNEANLVIVGNIDPSYALASPAHVHGDYKLSDIPALVRNYGITDWFIPSIWPETFSYATHEAIATGLPVWSFDLGAQGDAVAASSGEGGIIPLDAVKTDPTLIIDIILNKTRDEIK